MVTESDPKNSIELFSIVLGWLLGILGAIIGSVIIEKIKKYFSKCEIKRGILAELREIQLRLAATCFISTLSYGDFSEDWAKWFKPYFKILIESEEFDYLKEGLKTDIKIDDYSDKQFYNYLVQTKIDKVNISVITTQNYPQIVLPYLDSNYHILSLLNKKFVNSISKLKREISSINSDFNKIWFYHSKTFENISDINYDNALKNIENFSRSISKKSKHIVLLIEKINSL